MDPTVWDGRRRRLVRPAASREFLPLRSSMARLRAWPPLYLSFAQSLILLLSFRHGPHKSNERALELGSEANLGRLLHHFPSRTRWNGSRGQIRPDFCLKPAKQTHTLVSKQSDGEVCDMFLVDAEAFGGGSLGRSGGSQRPPGGPLRQQFRIYRALFKWEATRDPGIHLGF